MRSFSGAVIRNADYYFRTGITWPIKNRFSFKPWPLPRGCVFAHVGASGFSSEEEPPRSLHGLLRSQLFTDLLRVSAGWNYEVGIIQLTPVPHLDAEARRHLGELARRAWTERRSADVGIAESHAFIVPALLATFETQRAQAGTTGSAARELDRKLERQTDLISELNDFRDKLRRAAGLHLVPDLNDGVVLNIAPLWELVPWKEAKKYWDELLAGKYEWSSIGKQLREKGLVK